MSKMDDDKHYHCAACQHIWVPKVWTVVRKATVNQIELIMCPYCNAIRGMPKK